MTRPNRARGLSLIELLLVIALIGILSGIAIPSFMGQRRRARVIGDAQSNARVIAMALETRKADNGIYGTGGPYTWTVAAGPSDATFLPTLSLQALPRWTTAWPSPMADWPTPSPSRTPQRAMPVSSP